MENYQRVIALVAQIRENANRMIVQGLRERGVEDLAPSHGAILVQLYKKRTPLRMGELTEAINKDKSTVTALVNKLVKLGYIRRIKDPSDSRITLAELTEKGWAIEESFYQVSDEVLGRLYRGFSDEERDILVSKLDKMADNS